MAWKKISNQENTMWDFEKNNMIEGKYISKEENQGPRKNSTIYSFEVSGEDINFWGSTVLDGKMKSVEIGNKVKITFVGMRTNKTGTEYKDFDVEVWETTPEELPY